MLRTVARLVLLAVASAMVLPARLTPMASGLPLHSPRLTVMQVDAPVRPKVPDNAPQLAPTKPSSDKDNEKAKKYKVLLFNDNVNRYVRACRNLSLQERG